MSNVFSQAAAPVEVAALEAVDSFLGDLGADPVQWAVRAPGALVVLQGKLMLAVPALAVGEGGAVMTALRGKLADAIAKAKAAETPPAA